MDTKTWYEALDRKTIGILSGVLLMVIIEVRYNLINRVGPSFFEGHQASVALPLPDLGNASAVNTAEGPIQGVSSAVLSDTQVIRDHQHNQTRKFPKMLLIGVKKCGTAAFRAFLALNPYFAVVPYAWHFFDLDAFYAHGPDYYKSTMPFSFAEQITVEGTPNYFTAKHAPGRVRDLDPSMKLMLIVCDPAKRLVSEYVHLKSLVAKARGVLAKNGTMLESQTLDLVRQYGRYPTFSEIVFNKNDSINLAYNAIHNGIYIKDMRTWTQYFPLSHMLLIDGSSFRKEPWTELNNVAKFAGVPAVLSAEDFIFDKAKGFYCRLPAEGGCMSVRKGRPHPDIPESKMNAIRDFYRPYNEQFYQLVHKNFSW